ncbi:hypothetical protein Lepto7376_0741 [[Leptolyngbya] sp. PCC 7376]|uniref:hypothetical protein n=1 Tax=[Leptolyngbya] sp. PCC 7376 TaxID=111781 RepID=UPI00029ED8C1|nr:hypothetical protein [[Leptolyngbya] sp. PCC 7376]AFY37139.1 hypothetical protein Lepto7376_0741 [[Leptolyngbya] sp. PCC 7376]
MNTQQQVKDISTGDRAVMACMAALVMFVAGYTASRMVLTQTTPSDNAAAENTVVPHQGELWRAFGE